MQRDRHPDSKADKIHLTLCCRRQNVSVFNDDVAASWLCIMVYTNWTSLHFEYWQ